MIELGATIAFGSGGIASGLYRQQRRQRADRSTGVATGNNIGAGGSLLIASAGIGSANTVTTGGVDRVLNGGFDSGSTVQSGGLLIVSSGGVISGLTISSGGALELDGGAINAGGLTFNSGAILEVGSGFVQTVSSGQTVTGRPSFRAVSKSFPRLPSPAGSSFPAAVRFDSTVDPPRVSRIAADRFSTSTHSSTVGSGTTFFDGVTLLSSTTMVLASGSTVSGVVVSSAGQQVVSSGGSPRVPSFPTALSASSCPVAAPR